MNLYLIGYRGSGKSTIAPLIAKKIGWKNVDSDDLIEAKANKKVSEIFAASGEDEFRRLERLVIKQAAAKNQHVVSLGGGAPTFEANRTTIKQRGTVVYLKGSWETLWKRISGDESTESRRPDLTEIGGAEEVRQLLKQRGPIYEACADYTIDIDTDSPEVIAARIVKWFKSDDR